MQDYVDFLIKGHEDETGNQIKCVYENVNDRWEVSSMSVFLRFVEGKRRREFVLALCSLYLVAALFQRHIYKVGRVRKKRWEGEV